MYLKWKQLHDPRPPCSQTAVPSGQVSRIGMAVDEMNAPKYRTGRRSSALRAHVAALLAYCREVKQLARGIPAWLQPSPPSDWKGIVLADANQVTHGWTTTVTWLLNYPPCVLRLRFLNCDQRLYSGWCSPHLCQYWRCCGPRRDYVFRGLHICSGHV